ncbi:hypothetical protein BHE74_00028298 [Ensete ventricosum]|nr:hypothetical protein BHE74_00028298 [Ensete ventricosum]
MLGSGCHFGVVFLLILWSCSYKTRPSPEWWVPGKVPPTIKLALFRRVKSDVSPSDAGASSLLIEVRRERERELESLPSAAPRVSLLYMYVVDWSCLNLIILLMFSASLFNAIVITVAVHAVDYVLLMLCCRVVPSGSYEI